MNKFNFNCNSFFQQEPDEENNIYKIRPRKYFLELILYIVKKLTTINTLLRLGKINFL